MKTRSNYKDSSLIKPIIYTIFINALFGCKEKWEERKWKERKWRKKYISFSMFGGRENEKKENENCMKKTYMSLL